MSFFLYNMQSTSLRKRKKIRTIPAEYESLLCALSSAQWATGSSPPVSIMSSGGKHKRNENLRIRYLFPIQHISSNIKIASNET